MQQQRTSSRALCAYCDTHTRPNAMYCIQCGQIVTTTQKGHSGQQLSSPFPPQAPIAPVAPAAPRIPLQQHLPPMPGAPALPSPRSAASSTPAATASPEAVPPPLPQLSTQAAQIIELELPGGVRTQVHGTAVLGRMPEATARNSGAQAITVPDTTKSVSRAHALIQLHGRAVAVSDSGSANGSSVERDGNWLQLDGDREISLRNGDRIWLGEVPVEVHITRTTLGATR